MITRIHLHLLPLRPLFSSHKPSNHKPYPPLSFLTTTHSSSAPTSDSGLLFRQKILYLEALNVNAQQALNRNPHFRSAPLSALQSVEHCLSSMGLPRHSLGRILDMYPQLLTADPHSDLYPVYDFLLHEVAIPAADVPKAINGCPRILICSVPNQLRPVLMFLRNLGFVGSHAINSQTTLLLVSSVESTLLPKIEYLQSLGFDRGEVVKMVLRFPRLLTYSIENNFVPKVEYFLKEMKGDLDDLRRFPQFFGFSLEGKIKPRHRKLAQLGLSLPLQKMFLCSNADFNAMLIEMQLESVEGMEL